MESTDNTSSTNSNIMRLSSDPTTDKIMRELEKKAETQLAELMSPVANSNPIEKLAFVSSQSKTPDFGDKLVSIMSQGANEFQEKTGRKMTYSEMRSMYG
jgi:hypothetical protein